MELNKTIIGMVHVGALPGTPRNDRSLAQLIADALADAKVLQEEGVDAIMIENMHDRPYLNREVGAEVIASMTAIACALRSVIKIPLGIQILAGANKAALAVALAAGFDFVRAEGFVFGHLADEGMINSDAGELLRYRKQIGADRVKIFTDIKKKHSSHAVSSDVSIAETARAAEFFLSDGVIVTGSSTGEKPSLEELKQVKSSVKIPVLIGSGIGAGNINEYWNWADGFIVGSSLKKDGNWENKVERKRVKHFIKTINQLSK
ncbi:BtpA/SgcQ family protein [Maribellus sp. CM-23]|uniref:BtpA/SgcQ family protein n=1 Tax=Maribellus sp. CM-23 TaxID=2781026 RepID=UPI001F42342B|nr:BtpA/SgcQ family protein [Maribellus sp. CM-23]MCE4566743.1 BtpA/SgcQ family protein [Maribellus sp. CM-23]